MNEQPTNFRVLQQAIRAIISGMEISFGGLLTIDPADVADLVQTFGSVVWMVPTEALRGTDPVVVSNTTSYNYSQFHQLFADIGADVCFFFLMEN